MKTRNRFSLVVLPVAALLWIASAQTTEPVSAQGGMWEESALPDGYFTTGIKFFDDDHGRAYGRKYNQAESFPFILETADGGATWTDVSDELKKLEKWSRTFSINISGRSLSSECKYSKAENIYILEEDFIYVDAMVHCKSRVGGGIARESDDYGVFLTEDGGGKWERASLTDDLADGQVTDIVPAPDGGVWLVLYDNTAMLQQFMYSSDGARFEPRFISDLPANSIQDLAFPEMDFGYAEVFLSSIEDKRYSHSVRVTRDVGATWTELPPLPDLQFEHLSDFFFLDEKTGWAAGYASGEQGPQAAFLRTTDGGRSWEETLIMPSGEEWFELSMQSMKFKNPQVGFVIGGLTMAESQQAILFMTADGGTVWEEVLQDTYIGCLETTDTQVFVCASGGILRMELPAPRPTPTPTLTPTLTPVPPSRTPIPSVTPTPLPLGLEGIQCASAPILIVLLFALGWFAFVRR